MKTRGKRKEVARVFFNVGTYLATTVAVGGLLVPSISLYVSITALAGAAACIVTGYIIYPFDKGDKETGGE